MKKILPAFVSSISFLLLLLFPKTISAQIRWNSLYSGTGFAFSTNSTIGDIISSLLNYLFPIAGLLLLLYLIYGGFTFLTSAGDPNKAQVAKGIITTALIGFVIIFTSYWLVQIVAKVLGLPNIGGIF